MNVAVQTRESSETAANAGEVEIDPRPCGLCGLTIERHEMADDGEGPEHYCPEPDELTLFELERRAELVRQIEVAAIVRGMELEDPRDRWKHTGEAPPDIGIPITIAKPPYRTPQSTIDAFWYVVRLDDADYLKRWLAQHPGDVVTLQKLWDGKHARI
jgi:hypothetical protein